LGRRKEGKRELRGEKEGISMRKERNREEERRK
jgi:hypothetical protein